MGGVGREGGAPGDLKINEHGANMIIFRNDMFPKSQDRLFLGEKCLRQLAWKEHCLKCPGLLFGGEKAPAATGLEGTMLELIWFLHNR